MIVAPGHNMVLPLMPEFISAQDGAEKQDCERNASKRWLIAHGERVKQLRPVYLGPSILINAAGVFRPIDMVNDSDPAAWIDTLMINTIAPYLMCRAFVGGVISAGWGRVVNVTLAVALREPGPAGSAYAISKAALNQFTRHLAAELNCTGVTANVIHPGDVKTDMWAYIRDASERLGSVANAYVKWANWVDQMGGDNPEKAADLVASLMRDDVAKINGRFLWIKDGLQNPIPSWGEPGKPQPSR